MTTRRQINGGKHHSEFPDISVNEEIILSIVKDLVDKVCSVPIFSSNISNTKKDTRVKIKNGQFG